LLAYVSGGGSLLITGPLDRDEHWHLVSRAASTNLDAHAGALTYHNAVIKLSDRTISLSFDQQKRNAQSREAAIGKRHSTERAKEPWSVIWVGMII
jgi:hypothetical protein